MGIDAFAETTAVDPRSGSRGDAAGGLLAALSRWVEARALFIVAACLVVTLSVLGIPRHLSQDGWLALVAGRQIAAHGIPQHDYLTHLGHGVRWVDQQWLAQLAMYELQRVGGLQLLTVLYVLVTGAAFTGGIAAARALGGEDLHVLASLLPGAFFYLVTAVSIRTQGLAYPLFVLTLWLLASASRDRSRSRRVFWVFPVLVLWANLHGSATLGVGLAGLYGLTLLITGLRKHGLAGLGDGRAWAFIVVSPVTLLATPYGLGVVHYYAVTLMNSRFGRIVTEWKPVSSVPILAIPLGLLIAFTAYAQLRAFLRARSGAVAGLPAFDALVLLTLSIGAVTAVRNVTWFGLGLMMLLPAAVTRMRHRAPAPLRRARVNRLLAVVMIMMTALTTAVVLARPTSWFTSTYPSESLPKLESLVTRDPRVTLLADVRYADWLIWEDPRLFSGRVAYDTSFELLTPRQLVAIGDLAAPDARWLVGSYRIWLLDPGNHSLNRTLLRRPGVKVLSRTKKMVIAINTRVAET